MPRPFLKARWESLLLLNYECPEELLLPLVPEGTTLDPWTGVPLVSLVGFLFRETRVLGVGIPWHRNFEEVNLRFYVRRKTPDGELRRAVVFVRELVPRRAIATVARVVYNEPYLSVPMQHRVSLDPEAGGSLEYSWRHRGTPFALRGKVHGPATLGEPGSEAEFITEHYWGYTRQRDGGTMEYQVEHPRWRLWSAESAEFSGASSGLYGAEFAEVLGRPPRSAFVALGSEVAVHHGKRLNSV